MAVSVVDASAIGALLFGEPEGVAIADRLRGATLVAPALLSFEIANVCLKKLRRFPARRDAWLEGFGLLAHMHIGAIEVDHGAVLDLAERTGLTSYDASYLWLAHQLDAELVTLDAQLEAAATATRRV